MAERYLPNAVNDVLMSQAAAALESRNYNEYEALLIRAERTDIILMHYKEQEMWSDAIRIAKEYAPSAVGDIQRLEAKASRLSGTTSDAQQLLHDALEYARKEQFRKAVNCLMKIDHSNADAQMIEKALLRAADMYIQFLQGTDSVEVARTLAPRLAAVDQIDSAVRIYLAADMPKEAVDVFIQSENWSKARRLAKEIDPQLLTYVAEQQKVQLRSDGNIEQLADIGEFTRPHLAFVSY